MSAEKIAARRAEYVRSAEEQFDRYLDKATESPIEALLLAQMLVDGWGSEHSIVSWSQARARVAEAGLAPNPWVFATDECACVCQAQTSVAYGSHRYRIDFAFIGVHLVQPDVPPQIVKLAVELDGHDFHERTKEQASKDKRRDRVLAANGWAVLRFSGSDVYRDPAAVIEEIVTVANRLCWPEMG